MLLKQNHAAGCVDKYTLVYNVCPEVTLFLALVRNEPNGLFSESNLKSINAL